MIAISLQDLKLNYSVHGIEYRYEVIDGYKHMVFTQNEIASIINQYQDLIKAQREIISTQAREINALKPKMQTCVPTGNRYGGGYGD